MVYRVYRRRAWDYFLPLFIFIAFIAVVILAFLFVRELNTDQEPLDIYLYTLRGKTRILPWGTNEWQMAYNESRLLQGDALKTLRESRAAVRFFDTLWMRLDSETDVTFREATVKTDRDDLSFSLQKGSVWFFTEPVLNKTVTVFFETGRFILRMKGAIFSLEKGANEIVRVLSGKVFVDIVSDENNKKRVLETLTISSGEQIVLTPKVFTLFKDFRNPEIIEDISQDFIQSDWYVSNTQLDRDPFSFTRESFESSLSSFDQEDVTPPQSPVIVRPIPSERMIITDEILIEGRVETDVVSVIVTTFENEKPLSYVLSKFRPGDSVFRYLAAVRYGNLKEGRNVFSITVKDAAGHESEPVEVEIFYGKKEL